jgi:hypothetical protein
LREEFLSEIFVNIFGAKKCFFYFPGNFLSKNLYPLFCILTKKEHYYVFYILFYGMVLRNANFLEIFCPIKHYILHFKRIISAAAKLRDSLSTKNLFVTIKIRKKSGKNQ